MHKVWIDTSFDLKRKTGIGAYILTLFECFKLNNILYKIIELNLPDKMNFKPIFRVIWQNTWIYLMTLIFKPDIFLSPSFICPILRRKKTKYITVIHDLAFFKEGLKKKKVEIILQWATKNAIKNSDIIITVSETIKKEILEKFDIEEKQIKVLYNSIGSHFTNLSDEPDILNKYSLIKNKYILSVASLMKHKNLSELINAFQIISEKHPDIKLVLVGKSNNEILNKSNNENIIFTGYVQDEELPTLYQNALLYAFPSLYEGFGIPIIEAQYCGCPVLCSDIPVFKEVAGEAAQFCQPDAKSVAENIEYLIANPEKCKILIKAGKENVKRFDMKKIAEQLAEVIQ